MDALAAAARGQLTALAEAVEGEARRLVRPRGELAGEGGDGRLVLGQSLFSGLRKTEAIVLSQSETRREEFQYQNIWRLLKTETTVAFYSVIQLETDIADLQNILKQMRERVEELKKRTQLGKSRESEILAVESQMATFQAQQEKSKGERAEAMETISRLIGVDSAVLALSDDTPAVNEPGNLDNYLETVKSRPDIETARQDVLIQSARVRITRGSLLPELDLDGSWHTNRSGSLSDGKWDTTLSLDIPLFQGGTVRNKLKEDVSRQQELENIVILRQCDAATEVQKLYQAVLSSYNQAQSYQEAYRKAGKSYQLQLRDYRFGLVNNLDVIQAMSMLSDTKRNMDRSLIQLKSDQAVLDIAADKE